MNRHRVAGPVVLLIRAAFLILAGAWITGCSPLARVHPWERATLARTDMTFDSENVDLEIDDHMYFSREATAGGRSFGGGGCGCN